MTLVSVIIPAYNAEKYITDAINSVLAQRVDDIEIIVVDDGSEDKTAEVAEKLPKVKVIKQKHQGIPFARNNGVRNSSGKYISFIDSDDLWTVDKLKKQLSIFENNSDVDMVDGHKKNLVEDFVEKPEWLHEKSFLPEGVVTYGITTILVKKEIFTKVGLFNENFPQQQDVEWYVRVKDSKANIVLLNEVFVIRRIHGKNISYNRKQNQKFILKILADSIKKKREG